jgi:transposase
VFGIDRSVKIFLYGKPCDMRKGFNGLYGLVQNEMQMSPLCRYLFIFISSDRIRLKILFWDIDGLVLYCKRLERGTFKRPSARINALNSELTHDELYMILRGIDFEKTKKRKRFLYENAVDNY